MIALSCQVKQLKTGSDIFLLTFILRILIILFDTKTDSLLQDQPITNYTLGDLSEKKPGETKKGAVSRLAKTWLVFVVQLIFTISVFLL